VGGLLHRFAVLRDVESFESPAAATPGTNTLTSQSGAADRGRRENAGQNSAQQWAAGWASG
jgi:hypothetical protein